MIADPLAALGGRRIGAHLALGHGMVKAADRAGVIGATALQVFTDNPTTWRRRATPPRELAAFRDRLAALDIAPIASHAAYLVNLAGPDADFWQRSVDVLTAELLMARRYGARLVNMHTGSHRGTDAATGLRQLGIGIARAFEAAEAARAAEAADPVVGADAGTATGDRDGDGAWPLLVLENSAGSGDAMGVSVEDLADCMAAIEDAGVPLARIGVCLDTAHLWGAGVDISRPDVIDELLERADRLLGPERLAMFHINDSKAALGSRLDRHEHIGGGRIGEVGMRHVVTHPRLALVPMFLETPGMDEGYDAVNMARVRGLVAGQPLEPLPPEAFTLRGSRASVAPAEA